jgi:excisionase family DNA binding protein
VEKLLTMQQLIELIQISRSILYEWTHCGFMSLYRFPNGVRFKETEIDDWLRKRQRKGKGFYLEFKHRLFSNEFIVH